MQVIFIAGTGLSGSTLLSLMLSQHPRLVALGEIHGMARFGLGPRGCSCGSALENCPFWSVVIQSFRSIEGTTTAARLHTILTSFQELFGHDRIPIDSGKDLAALEALQKVPNVQTKVIHLIRDVRSWTEAALARPRPTSTARAVYGWKSHFRNLPFLRKSALVRYIQWYRTNRKIQAYLEQTKTPTLQISYEELALYPKEIVPRICDFLGLDVTETMFTAASGESHVGRGNRIRLQLERRRTILYGNRWFYRDDWGLASLLLPNVMRYNARHVYRNLRYPFDTQ